MNWWRRFNRSSAHTQANIVCTVIIAVATVAYSIIAARQLGNMDEQLPELKKSAQAAKVAAETASSQYRLARQEAESTQAAIVVAEVSPSVELGNILTLNYRLHNVGKSAAEIVIGDFQASIKGKDMPAVTLSRGRLEVEGSLLGSSIEGSSVLRKVTIQDVRNGKATVTIRSKYSYRNGFDREVVENKCWVFMRTAIINSAQGNFWSDDVVDCNEAAKDEARNTYYAANELKSK